MLPFWTIWNYQKTSGFLFFFESRKGRLAWRELVIYFFPFSFPTNFFYAVYSTEFKKTLSNKFRSIVDLTLRKYEQKHLTSSCCTFLNYFLQKGITLWSNKPFRYIPTLASIFSFHMYLTWFQNITAVFSNFP